MHSACDTSSNTCEVSLCACIRGRSRHFKVGRGGGNNGYYCTHLKKLFFSRARDLHDVYNNTNMCIYICVLDHGLAPRSCHSQSIFSHLLPAVLATNSRKREGCALCSLLFPFVPPPPPPTLLVVPPAECRPIPCYNRFNNHPRWYSLGPSPPLPP